MNINPIILLISVATLFSFMLPGFILRKTHLIDDHFAKNISVYILYVAQACMLLHGFLSEFNKGIFINLLKTFALVFLAHVIFYIIARSLFKSAPEKRRRVLQFGVVFSNAGYMGIPVIADVFGDEYVIYATAYVVVFNVFAYSIGRLIYTGDKKYISVKKIFINPAVIPITIGVIIYVTGFGGFFQTQLISEGFVAGVFNIIYDVIITLKNTVAPASMIVVGAHLAELNLKGVFKDKYLYCVLLIRLIICPLIIWLILRPLLALNFISETIIAIVLVLSSTPTAANTTMFAELYDCDSLYSSKVVSISTLCSVITMPLLATLLYI